MAKLSKIAVCMILFGLASFANAEDAKPTVNAASTVHPTPAGTTSAANTASSSNAATADSTSAADIAGADDAVPTSQADPYQPFNRAMYRFNDVLDRVILKPVATVYNKIVPKPLAKGITNFFANVDTVPTVANDVLQANIYQATSDGWRLVINSTVGVLGFFDVASDMGLEPNKEDFGLTLARWGYTNSNYLVLPFFGPSTPRDAIGLPVDYYVFSIYPYITPLSARYEIYGLGVISRRADLLSFQNVMEEAAVDRYVFLRDAYLQRRAYLIQRNKELGDPYLEKNKQKTADSST